MKNSCGPGIAIVVELESDSVTEVFTGFGERGVAAEHVPPTSYGKFENTLRRELPSAPNLADQLLLPLAISGSGAFTTMAPSRHTLTNIEGIKKFLLVSLTIAKRENGWEVTCD